MCYPKKKEARKLFFFAVIIAAGLVFLPLRFVNEATVVHGLALLVASRRAHKRFFLLRYFARYVTWQAKVALEWCPRYMYSTVLHGCQF